MKINGNFSDIIAEKFNKSKIIISVIITNTIYYLIFINI